MKILIVDDDRACLEMWLSICEEFAICTATDSPKLAMRHFMESNPAFDLVITDYNMGIITGLALAEHIRRYERNEKLAPTPIVCITGVQADVLRFNEKTGKPITKVLCKGSIRADDLRNTIKELTNGQNLKYKVAHHG